MAETGPRASASPADRDTHAVAGEGAGGDLAIALLGEINESLRDMGRMLRIAVAVIVLILVVLVVAAVVISATAGQVQQRLGS